MVFSKSMNKLKGMSAEDHLPIYTMRKKMGALVKTWDNKKIEMYIDDEMDGFSDEQLAHIAWYLTNKLEEKKRFTEHQGDNMESSN